MLAEVFSHGLIRDFVVAFGTLFNNIKINRPSASGEDSNTLAIPIAYAPRQRYIERITEDLNLDKPVAMSLPRMSFEMVSMNYAAERKLNTVQRYYGRRNDTANNQLAAVYSPVPYDFNFQLSCYVENIEDGTHIIEQILPYFTPEFTVSLKSVTELGLNMDLPLVLNSVNVEDSYESGFDERRVIIWTLDFTMKAQLFGPVSNSGLINKIKINLRPNTNVAAASANTYEQILITPGQFANGLATTNPHVSIDPLLITANSDYGISTQIFNVGQDPNTFRYWGFDDGSIISTVQFGPAIGNTTIGGWETFESGTFAANGTAILSQGTGVLRHTLTKTASDAGGDAYESPLYLQIYANTTSDPEFEQFYGKNYQNVSIKFKTKQTTGTGAAFNFLGVLRWLTTDSGKPNWSTTTYDRYKAVTVPTDYSDADDPFSYDSIPDTYQTLEFDLSAEDDWNNQIVKALRFELFNASDPLGPMVIETDIDYIKISANTSS